MDIRLNALPMLPSALGSFLAAGTPRFSDLNEGDNAPRSTLHVVPSPVEEAIRIIPLFRLIEIESAQPALLVSENDIWTALSGIATTSMLSR